ncbi:uncharacterized protein E0L32_007726 [Thyridium curvatum]|uniref:Rhodopsin domain-containing protein n=1 Tax=Thyridium curvatum TaxID=1093900 RepID=A0A507ALL9_9PEZI|nr:uncharacterized protein E0L32_007726 [Thyridium curvatum]TPX11515.1 hypothetical protein E0L32_007726 [Thyridium curvatum]
MGATPIAEKAAVAIGLMWAMTAIILLFMAARLYMNIKVVRHMYADDVVYYITGVMMILCTSFTTIAATTGFGWPMLALPVEVAIDGKMWEMIGQTFLIVGMSTAKCSLGLFLLRIVLKKWHKMAIWIASISLLIVSSIAIILFWVQCLPAEANFDPRVPSPCIVDPRPVMLLTSIWLVVMDFFFATIPWVLVWNMHMRKKHKLVIIIVPASAGVCGIIRTTKIESIEKVNYTEDTVPLIIWSAAELTVTLVCIGVAVLIPLYKYLFVSKRRRRNKQQQSRRFQWREPIDRWSRRFDSSPNELTRTQDKWEKRVGLSPYLPDRYARGSACEAGEAANSRHNMHPDPETWQSRDTEKQHSDIDLAQLEQVHTADQPLVGHHRFV